MNTRKIIIDIMWFVVEDANVYTYKFGANIDVLEINEKGHMTSFLEMERVESMTLNDFEKKLYKHLNKFYLNYDISRLRLYDEEGSYQ